MPRIAIFTDDPGWHGARLRHAFAGRGYSSEYVSLTECKIIVEPEHLPILVPGFEHRLPDAVLVRGVPGGLLEEVVFYLDILHALKELGIPVYNDGRAIERSVDKGGLGMSGRQLADVLQVLEARVAAYQGRVAATEAMLAEHPAGSFGAGYRGRGPGLLVPAADVAAFVQSLKRPRVAVILVKAGGATDAVISALAEHMEKGDVIVDGAFVLRSGTTVTTRTGELNIQADSITIEVGASIVSAAISAAPACLLCVIGYSPNYAKPPLNCRFDTVCHLQS